MNCEMCPVKDQCKDSKGHAVFSSHKGRQKEDRVYAEEQLKKYCPLAKLIDREVQKTGRKIVDLTNEVIVSDINKVAVEQKIDEVCKC